MYNRELCARLITSPFTSNLDNALAEQEFIDGFKAGVRAQIASPGQLELITRLNKEYGNGKTKIGMVVGYPYGGMTTAVKCDLIRQAIKAGLDEVDLAFNVCAAASGDWDSVEKEMLQVMDIARGKIRVVAMLWMVKFNFETVAHICDIYRRVGITDIKTSAGIHFGEMLVEHIEWLHRNYPEMTIEVAGRCREREKAEAMIAAGASYIHTGSWRKLSGIGTDPAFNAETKDTCYGRFFEGLE